MPERTFFTLRYAVPGYTFILILILTAYPSLHIIFNTLEPIFDNLEIVGAFFAFLTLLSGGAIGFLISQPWYLFHHTFLAGRVGRYHDTRKYLEDNYKIVKNIHYQIFVSDYIHRLSNETLRDYTQRRFDLLHLCGSTLFAVIEGLSLGLLIQILSHTLTFVNTGFAILVALSITHVLYFSLKFTIKEHSEATYFSVVSVHKSGNFPLWKAKQFFPNEYFERCSNNIIQERCGTHNMQIDKKNSDTYNYGNNIKHLDRLFDVALILSGILSAAEFQYFLIVEEAELYGYILKVFTIPIVFLIISWLFKELSRDVLPKTITMLITEYCWDFWGFTLFFYLGNIILGTLEGVILSFLLTIFLIFFIQWAYGRASLIKKGESMYNYYKSVEWVVIRIMTFIGAYLMLVLMVYPF